MPRDHRTVTTGPFMDGGASLDTTWTEYQNPLWTEQVEFTAVDDVYIGWAYYDDASGTVKTPVEGEAPNPGVDAEALSSGDVHTLTVYRPGRMHPDFSKITSVFVAAQKGDEKAATVKFELGGA